MGSRNFNELIHQERTRLLGLLPKGADVFCSAGCSGAWYFKWIEESYGPVKKHIGIELYSEMPDALPKNVDWIKNSVSNMVDIQSDSVDLMFSGQNIEHLYPGDLIGFFNEANRVTKPGGILCIDSPNRSVTQSGRYIQPEHVLELSVAESASLVRLAGFSISTIYGIWLCEDGQEHFEVLEVPDSASLDRRLSHAKYQPSNSFIWWIVASKVGDVSGTLRTRVEELFLKDYPGFVRSRFSLSRGRFIDASGTEAIIEVSEEVDGCVFFGPYVPLVPGAYFAEFLIRQVKAGGTVVFEVVSDLGKHVHASWSIDINEPCDWRSVKLNFSLDVYTTGIETRLVSHGSNILSRFGSQIVKCG